MDLGVRRVDLLSFLGLGTRSRALLCPDIRIVGHLSCSAAGSVEGLGAFHGQFGG